MRATRLLSHSASLHAKLMLALALVVVLVAAGTAYVLIAGERDRRLLELEGRATRIADLFSHSLAQPLWNVDRASIENQLAALAPNPEVAQFRVTAVNYGAVSEVIKLREADLTNAVVRTRAIEYVPLPGAAPQKIGEVRVVLTRAVAEEAIAAAGRSIVGLVVAAVALLYAVTFVLLKRMVSGPTRRLEETVDRIAGGDLSARCAVESGDEVGRLAVRINAMADRLRDSMNELRSHRDQLERAVAERTVQLVEAKERAEVANRTKSAFLANMSHELRTPLNSILGFTQILQRNATLDAQQADWVSTIEQSGEHLLTLINDILDLSRIEAGKLELQPELIDLPAFLEGIVDIMRIKAEEKRLKFDFDAAPDLPRCVEVDAPRLRQVLLNLVGNALKFTDRGQVSLRVHRLPGGDARARLRFEVHDTGVGIDPRLLETIFQPFEQVGDTRRRAAGSGLGLTISRQIVRLMGSDITVESALGAGSRFRFDLSLPVLAVITNMPAGERPHIVGYRGARRKVLIADDVAANRNMLANLLEPLGFAVQTAVDGVHALELARTAAPDLIVMDIMMPVLDGLSAIRRLRQMSGLMELPVIAVSASALEGDRERSLQAGANAFVAKPISIAVLLEEIGRLLSLDWIGEDATERNEPARAR
ncbi:MAG TPA: ATP-binding protein [Burkholderiaceae bacterium]|nr:ATP-binding protein [Burkholderiaceae bacterium]